MAVIESEHTKTREEIDKELNELSDKKMITIDGAVDFFDDIERHNLQKGVVGHLIETLVFKYDINSDQSPDLIVDGIPTELKSTGVVKNNEGEYVAKEPMSITAVGVTNIKSQTFETSHFWNKIKHLLIVYYFYDRSLLEKQKTAKPVDYQNFKILKHEFHEFNESEKLILERDWNYVHELCSEIYDSLSDLKPYSKEWNKKFEEEYIRRHTELRPKLCLIDLAPKYPPRFRLKKSVVNIIVRRHFYNDLEQLPGLITKDQVDVKCDEINRKYAGKTIAEIALMFDLEIKTNSKGYDLKEINEQILLKMFDSKSKKLNSIENFAELGIICKSVTLTAKNKRTEDCKLFKLDFDELSQLEILNSNSDHPESKKEYTFEDSEIYDYAANKQFLLAVFKEPKKEKSSDVHLLRENTFIGFKRIYFSDEFIENSFRKVWNDTRDKILNNKLKFEYSYDKNNNKIVNNSGSYRGAPNFIKSKDNGVFIRGGQNDSSEKARTEEVNGIKMIPQYLWLRGSILAETIEKDKNSI